MVHGCKTWAMGEGKEDALEPAKTFIVGLMWTRKFELQNVTII